MDATAYVIDGIRIPVISLDVAIIGSGCAGFNGADWLYDLGRKNIAIFTEGLNMGTSRNTGSDKQTYYKLSLASDGEDSVAKMAEDLFLGSGVHGDIALAEAANSVRCFIKLANLGVPFPTNEYGEYVGYKTDHDPRQRATSAGPLTSKYMTESLEGSIKHKEIPILDGFMAIKLLVNDNITEGLICLNKNELELPSMGITIVRAKRVILATGGPAGCYYDSVYPKSQTGMSGMALEAGAIGANLDQWQYGLASTKFRWNVSGTYQQVLPKYISIDNNGIEREFLPDYFDDYFQALDMVFLKGYQWPFSLQNLKSSSKIDMIVYHEIFNLGRRVYMDFRSDPAGLKDGFAKLGKEALSYLTNSNALFQSPIERLEKMNPLAIKLYRQHGIDLYQEPLEISVCVQHHNGGIAVDSNWETNIKGLYAVGEAAGTFGVHRPGGSALNSTQVGSMRAAQHIAYTTKENVLLTEVFETTAVYETQKMQQQFKSVIDKYEVNHHIMNKEEKITLLKDKREKMQKKMSLFASHIRDKEKIRAFEVELHNELEVFFENASILSAKELPQLLKTRDIFMTQLALLSAMSKAAKEVGSRGSALVLKNGGELIDSFLPDFTYESNHPLDFNMVLTTRKDGNQYSSEYMPVREIPQSDGWFENVWNNYRSRTGQ